MWVPQTHLTIVLEQRQYNSNVVLHQLPLIYLQVHQPGPTIRASEVRRTKSCYRLPILIGNKYFSIIWLAVSWMYYRIFRNCGYNHHYYRFDLPRDRRLHNSNEK